MPSTGPGLGDVLGLALERWQPRLASPPSGTGPRFGAAGRRGMAVDFEISSALPSPHVPRAPESRFTSDTMSRLFSTDIGLQAIRAVGNEPRALAALERLSVETMAASLRSTGQARNADRLLVIPKEQRRPPILMLMLKDVASVDESRVISEEMDLPLPVLLKGLSEAADPNEQTPEAAAMREVLRGGEPAVAEMFLIAQPEIVRTRQPRMIPLCVPSPHMQVDSGGKLSTAGMLCRDADGELGMTACYHGTGPAGTLVTVDQRNCRVKRDSQVQDTVFIPLGRGFNIPQLVGLSGVLEDREPAKADRVRFDGATNQNRQTRIFGTDAGLLRARPTIMLKLQTDPDTDQGDSGCALLDDKDRVLGFAFERTDYNDYPQFTDWIWAANALRALQLTPYK